MIPNKIWKFYKKKINFYHTFRDGLITKRMRIIEIARNIAYSIVSLDDLPEYLFFYDEVSESVIESVLLIRRGVSHDALLGMSSWLVEDLILLKISSSYYISYSSLFSLFLWLLLDYVDFFYFSSAILFYTVGFIYSLLSVYLLFFSSYLVAFVFSYKILFFLSDYYLLLLILITSSGLFSLSSFPFRNFKFLFLLVVWLPLLWLGLGLTLIPELLKLPFFLMIFWHGDFYSCLWRFISSLINFWRAIRVLFM